MEDNTPTSPRPSPPTFLDPSSAGRSLRELGLGAERESRQPPARISGGPRVREMSGTGPRSGPAGATAPARRKARSQASGASARRLRENKRLFAPGV